MFEKAFAFFSFVKLFPNETKKENPYALLSFAYFSFAKEK